MKRVAALYLPSWSIDRLRRVEQHRLRDAGASERSSTAPVRGEARVASDPAGGRSPSDDDAGFACGGSETPVHPSHQSSTDHPASSIKALAAQAAAETAVACSVPRGGGWRPGACWAKEEAGTGRFAAGPDHRNGSDSGSAHGDSKGQRPGIATDDRHRVGSGSARRASGYLRSDNGVAIRSQTAPEPATTRPRHRSREEGRSTEAVEHLFRRLRGDDAAASRSIPITGRSDPPGAHSPAPLVTTHRIGSRVEIAAACDVARALGIRPGMALTQARAQVPGLVVRAADHDGDHAELQRLALVLARRFAPIVAIDGTAGLLIDITGTPHLHGGERAMAARLVRQLARRGYAARVAIAGTPGAAHALARHAPTAITLSHDDAAALAPLPVQALRIDPGQVELLRRLGVDRIDQLRTLARGPLARRLGSGVVAQLDKALGSRPEPLTPTVPSEPIAIVQRFAEPIATAEAIEHWLGTLTPRLTHALATAGLGARRIEVIADRVDAIPQRIRIGLARPTRDPAHILRLMVQRIGDIEPGYGIDALTLHLRAADPLGAVSLAPELAEDGAPDLAPLIDTLTTRGSATWRRQPVESDVPERSVADVAPLEPPGRVATTLAADDVRRLDRSDMPHAWHPRWPRPVRLLGRPEPLDNVMALMPDGAPRRFVWRGRSHTVVCADGPERIAGEWWRRGSERTAIRDYFRVEDDAGARFWLYRRGDGERDDTGDLRWFLHGLFA